MKAADLLPFAGAILATLLLGRYLGSEAVQLLERIAL